MQKQMVDVPFRSTTTRTKLLLILSNPRYNRLSLAGMGFSRRRHQKDRFLTEPSCVK